MNGFKEMERSAQDIIKWIEKLFKRNPLSIIGIDGGAGAGKTTLTHWLANKIKILRLPVSVVHVDSFYPSLVNRHSKYALPSDCDWNRLKEEVIVPLGLGRSARFQSYNWLSDSLSDTIKMDATGIFLIEGVNALRKELRNYYALRIWLTCSNDIRIYRIQQRGDMTNEEIDSWMPSEDRYVQTHSPEPSAHIVVDTSHSMNLKGGSVSEWRIKKWKPPQFR